MTSPTHTRSITNRRTAAVLIAGAAALTAVAGCDAGGSEPGVRADRPPAVKSTIVAGTTDNDGDGDILTTYRHMWSAFERAIHTTEHDPAPLAAYSGGQALDTLTGALKGLDGRYLPGTGGIHISPTLVSAAFAAHATTATVRDCLDDTSYRLIPAAHTKPYTDAGNGRPVRASLTRLKGGAWKVTHLSISPVGGCDIRYQQPSQPPALH